MNRIYLSILMICTLGFFAVGCGSSQGVSPNLGYGSALTTNGVIPSPYGYGLASQVPWINNGYSYNGVYGSCPLGYVSNGLGQCILGGAGLGSTSCSGGVPGYAGNFAWNGGLCVGSGLTAYSGTTWNYGTGAFVGAGISYYPSCHFKWIFWYCY